MNWWWWAWAGDAVLWTYNFYMLGKIWRRKHPHPGSCNSWGAKRRKRNAETRRNAELPTPPREVWCKKCDGLYPENMMAWDLDGDDYLCGYCLNAVNILGALAYKLAMWRALFMALKMHMGQLEAIYNPEGDMVQVRDDYDRIVWEDGKVVPVGRIVEYHDDRVPPLIVVEKPTKAVDLGEELAKVTETIVDGWMGVITGQPSRYPLIDGYYTHEFANNRGDDTASDAVVDRYRSHGVDTDTARNDAYEKRIDERELQRRNELREKYDMDGDGWREKVKERNKENLMWKAGHWEWTGMGREWIND